MRVEYIFWPEDILLNYLRQDDASLNNTTTQNCILLGFREVHFFVDVISLLFCLA